MFQIIVQFQKRLVGHRVGWLNAIDVRVKSKGHMIDLSQFESLIKHHHVVFLFDTAFCLLKLVTFDLFIFYQVRNKSKRCGILPNYCIEL